MGWGRECVTPVLVSSLKLSASSNWIGVFSKLSEADIWLSSYDHLTDVGGQMGGCQQLSQRKAYTTQQEGNLKWIDPSN